MKDLQNTKLMMLKAALFLVIALYSAALLWMETQTFRTAALLVLTVWGFCRAYYFAFYVIEKYVDPQFRFAGLGSFLVYLARQRKKTGGRR
ncbi:MAG TPA: hypothetical protein VN673_15970 [Clostridia bacterium]|nr:hypothetical protein [Clostridia bacterium]